jgi:ribosomal protein L35AE/L33A
VPCPLADRKIREAHGRSKAIACRRPATIPAAALGAVMSVALGNRLEPPQ